MNRRNLTLRILPLTLACIAAASLPGCIIIAEHRDSDSSSGSRVRLTRDERETLPRVQTVADLPNVQRRHAEQIRTLGPETTIDDFRGRLPGAYFIERRNVGGADFDAYALRLDEKYRYRDASYGYVARDEQWFYFKNGRFVKYGAPNQWPLP